MLNSAKSRAEEKFTMVQSKAKQALMEKKQAEQEMEERIAQQRGLRLAREAVDKQAADKAAALSNKKARVPRTRRS